MWTRIHLYLPAGTADEEVAVRKIQGNLADTYVKNNTGVVISSTIFEKHRFDPQINAIVTEKTVAVVIDLHLPFNDPDLETELAYIELFANASYKFANPEIWVTAQPVGLFRA